MTRCCAIIVMCWCAAIALAPAALSQNQTKPTEAASLVDQAAAAMKDGQFHRALELYGQARTALPNNPEIPYNMGVAAYRAGDFENAAEHLKDAVGLTNDAKLRQKGIYNLGNAAYAQSLKAMQGQADPAQAQQQLKDAGVHVKEALQQFKQAMDADAKDEDARVNAELSHRLLKQLEQMQQQMQQQQQQNQDQQQDQQDQQGQEQRNQEPQNQDQKSEDQKEQDQQDQQQQSSNQDQQQDEQQQSEAQQSPPPEPKPNEAIEAQEQEKPQTQPEDKGERAATSQPEQRKQMTREAAERMLQLVRDKERKRREQLNRREAMKYAPAEKDW